MDAPITADEIMVVCMARQVDDGETVVQGLATPLVAAAYLLAKHTHAPHLYFASAIGQGICRKPAPLGLLYVESLWLDRSLTNTSFVNVATQVLPTLKPKEFFRPGQVDAQGNFNNIAFGKDVLQGGRPRLRLPGSGGIPDVTTMIERVHLYVPRHSRVTFVPELDVRSGMGHTPDRRKGAGPQSLTTDLGFFDFKNGRMRLVSWHPGTSPEQIQSRTGFELEIAPSAGETPLPNDEEIRLLREEIDPLGIRRLELLGGNARRQLLHEIIDQESANSIAFQS
jgi:acyl CoA:acetate/3-ketoacid CoA transferase beta subunit